MTEKRNITISSARGVDSGSQRLSRKARWKFAGVTVLIFTLLFSLLLIILSNWQRNSNLGVVLTTPLVVATPDLPQIIHSFPDTTKGIYVFNDQLAVWEMSEAQFEFAATHYVGAQKLFVSDVRRLRAHNPNFVVLNYRLGLGLGYRNIKGDCEPSGAWLEVIEGEKWVREFPENPPDEWFYRFEGQRVLFCKWGWYVMDISNTSWREYWIGEVSRQLRANAADGVFVDSLFPPNYFGGNEFDPELPAVDQVFEESWSTQIEDFIAFGKDGELTDYYFIPNVGEWVTKRDDTDYSSADGLMVEGFGRWETGEYFSEPEGDWQLQVERILSMVNLDKIVLLQQYVNDVNDLNDRLFLLGSYLLVKGNHTFINLEFSSEPEWFPEYEIPIGTPVGSLPSSIGSLWRSDWGVYARAYDNGLVLVNPSDQPREIVLQKTYYQAFPYGGGIVPADGEVPGWEVDYVPVTNISLGPNQAAILLEELPGQKANLISR